MNVSSIKTIFKNPIELTSKIVGACTLGSVLYDTHVNAKDSAIVKHRKDVADRFENDFRQYMTIETRSQTVADIKNWWFRTKQSFYFPQSASKVIGYTEGAIQTIVGNLPEIALGITALATKKYPVLGKIAAAILGVKAIKTLATDVIGLDK